MIENIFQLKSTYVLLTIMHKICIHTFKNEMYKTKIDINCIATNYVQHFRSQDFC